MVPRIVDLRSDTVTKPSEAMRAAMASAEVDDDVLGRDPSCFRLETEMAKILGKEGALFVPSGTMANLISVLVHCDIRGSEVILGDNSHIHIYENGGIATLGGVHPRTVRNNEDGTMVVRPWLFYLLSEQNTNAIMELSVLLKTKGIPRLIASCQRTVATSRRTSKSK